MHWLFTPSWRWECLGLGMFLGLWAVIISAFAGFQPPWITSTLAWCWKGVAGCYIAYGLGIDVLLRRWTALARFTTYLRSALFQWQVAAFLSIIAVAAYLTFVTSSATTQNDAQGVLLQSVFCGTLLAVMHVVTAIRLWRKGKTTCGTQCTEVLTIPPALTSTSGSRQMMWKVFLLWVVVFLICLAVVSFRRS